LRIIVRGGDSSGARRNLLEGILAARGAKKRRLLYPLRIIVRGGDSSGARRNIAVN
jgi:hypothetical protein